MRYAVFILLASLLFVAPVQAQQMVYYSVQAGTGFFVNRDYAITNAHVVVGCDKVELSGASRDPAAEVVFRDEEHDLALIKTDQPPEDFAPLRTDIDDLKVGDQVMVMGFPGSRGMHGQYTLVNAKVEKLEINQAGSPWQFYITDVLQHGNSGGPVLDMSGNLIGVAEGMAKFSMVNAVTRETLSEQQMGVVITLRALQHFIEDRGVYVQWNSSGLYSLSEEAVEEKAKKFVTLVQCRKQVDAPPAESAGERP